MSQVYALLFDLFGTLVTIHPDPGQPEGAAHRIWQALLGNGIRIDYNRFQRAYLQQRKAEHRHLMSTLREISIHGRILNTLERFAHSASKRDRAVHDAVMAYYQPWLRYTRPRANCYLVLQHFGKSRQLALVSNFVYPLVFHKIVDKLGLRKYFDSIVVSGELGYIKPSPRIFKRALTNLRTPSQNSIMIGDDPYADIFGASRIGMMTIQIGGIRQPGTIEAKPTARVWRLAQLPKVVAAMEATRTTGHSC